MEDSSRSQPISTQIQEIAKQAIEYPEMVFTTLVLQARINGNEMAGINGSEGRQKEAREGLWG